MESIYPNLLLFWIAISLNSVSSFEIHLLLFSVQEKLFSLSVTLILVQKAQVYYSVSTYHMNKTILDSLPAYIKP